MPLHYLPYNKIHTGNQKLDNKISYLLDITNIDITEILDSKGRISCQKIDEQLPYILGHVHLDIQIIIQETLQEVRDALSQVLTLSLQLKNCQSLIEMQQILQLYKGEYILNNISLNILLKGCGSIDECEDILNTYGDGISFDTLHINTLLNKCSSISESEYILGKYKEGLTLDVVSFSIILKIILQDKDIDISRKKTFIRYTLIHINTLGQTSQINEPYLIAKVLHSSYKDFIYMIIHKLKLENLYFLSTYLEVHNKISRKQKRTTLNNKNKEKELNIFSQKLQEARNAGLDGLAYLYASGNLEDPLFNRKHEKKKNKRILKK